jgi:hypothetical protein
MLYQMTQFVLRYTNLHKPDGNLLTKEELKGGLDKVKPILEAKLNSPIEQLFTHLLLVDQ